MNPPSASLAKLQHAARLLQSGDTAGGESVLRALLEQEPQNADALALTGLARAQLGDNTGAAELMARAIALNPDHLATHFNYGNVLGKLERWGDAVEAYTNVLARRPDHPAARRGRGLALIELKRDGEALADLDAIDGDQPAMLLARARLRFKAGRATEAIGDYDRIVALVPDHWEAWNNRGIALDQLERYEDALLSYDKALALKPDDENVLHNRGACLICLQRYDEALPLFERLIASDPAHADNWSCHGVALASLMRIEEALVSFERGLTLDPVSMRALNGTGMALTALGRVDEAADVYRRTIELYPGNPMTHGNLAFALLVAGHLREGFEHYEWRRKDGPIGRSQRNYVQPEWQGEPLAGRTLLLHPEQGLGDVVQFSRFVPQLIAQGARVVLEVPAGLERLLRTVAPEVAVVRSGDVPPPFDVHAPIMSLGHILGLTLDTIPAQTPYLHAEDTARALWRDRLAALPPGPRVGLCWSGNSAHRNDHARSIPLADFVQTVNVGGINLVSLQREVRDSDREFLAQRPDILDRMALATDFADTAALISELDLVITVDTSVAHVAGALGKPVWILIASAPDWRWLLKRNDSPWYPTTRLFRQRMLGDWRPVLEDVREALRAFAG